MNLNLKTLFVQIVYAKGCKDCIAMEKEITDVLSKSQVQYDLKKILFEEREAIKLAIRFGAEEIPFCVIRSHGNSICVTNSKFSRSEFQKIVDNIIG